MKNIDFLKYYARILLLFKKKREVRNPFYEDSYCYDEYYDNLIEPWNEYIYEGYSPSQVLSYILKLYNIAKKEGFTEEQRQKFFSAIKTHNKYTKKMILSVSIKISYNSQDESPLHGEYEMGLCTYRYRLDENKEKPSVSHFKKLQKEYKKCFFSIEGEHIKSDTIKRITLKETLERWKKIYKFIEADEIRGPYPHEDLPF